MSLNYTEVYKKIYKEIKTESIPHTLAHSNALKITNSIMEIYVLSLGKNKKLAEVVLDTVSSIKSENL